MIAEVSPELVGALTTAITVGVFPSAAAAYMLWKLTTSINGKLDRLGVAVEANTKATGDLSKKLTTTRRRT